ncbi:MAG: hypothetical protein Q9226_001194 [Calogaya cf. arnoldii]
MLMPATKLAWKPRLIDQVPETLSPADGHVEVPVLGMSRTGSSKTGGSVDLTELNSHKNTMFDLTTHGGDRHLHYWNEALKAKYTARGKPYQVKEFNKLFKGYNSFYAVLRWRTMKLAAYLDPVNAWKITSLDRAKLIRRQALLGPYLSLLHMVMDLWMRGNWKDKQALRQGFLDHYKHVRAAVPEDRILEFRFEDGWEPLNSFLQKPIPTVVPYPYVNEGVGVVPLHAFLYWIRLTKALGRMATV